MEYGDRLEVKIFNFQFNLRKGEYTDSPLQCKNGNVGADPCICPNVQHRKMSGFTPFRDLIKRKCKHFLSLTGFTAVELMIVLAIMGIMLVAAIPSFVQFTRNSRIKSGAQMVVSALRTARSYAITKRKNCMAIVDTTMNAVKVYENDTGTLSNWKVMPKTIVINHDIQPARYLDMPYPDDSAAVGAYESKPTVEFKPTGAIVNISDDDVIKISDETHENTSYIGITQITGRIKTSRE